MRLLVIVFMLSVTNLFGQTNDSMVYAFINQKIENDCLFNIPLSAKNAWIDTSDYDEYELAFIYILIFRDSSNLLINKYDSILNMLSNSDISRQVELNNKQMTWDQSQVKRSQKFVKRVKRVQRWRRRNPNSHYSMSRPIFFNDGNNAIIEINMIWDPLFGRGYFEIYEKDKMGKWKRVYQTMTWMS